MRTLCPDYKRYTVFFPQQYLLNVLPDFENKIV